MWSSGMTFVHYADDAGSSPGRGMEVNLARVQLVYVGLNSLCVPTYLLSVDADGYVVHVAEALGPEAA